MLKSLFTQFEGHRVHYWRGGAGFPVLMLHGVGPGTSIVGNYGPVLEPLAEKCEIFAMDLIGFGESDRKRQAPYFDVDLWLRQGIAMLDLLPEGPCGIAGHSLGGALALKLAARSKRVVRVLTSSTIGAPYSITPALNGFWQYPKNIPALRESMSQMIYDPDRSLTDEMIQGRWSVLQSPGYAEYFGAMFASPRQRLIDAAVIQPDEYVGIEAEVVMLHGRDDRPCPAKATTLAIAESIPHADIHLFARCGHNLPRERAREYLASAIELFGRPVPSR